MKTAPVDMFTTLRPRLFTGPLLQDIKSIQASIARFGLLSPIIVTRSGDRLIVLDGRKRLAAIRRLAFAGRLPRSLVNIPYVEVKDAKQTTSDAPGLMSNRDLFNTVIDLFRAHQDVAKIAADLYLCRKTVKQVLMLGRLSPRLRKAFFDRTLDFGQAKAYAALPDHKTQEAAFLALGPFARDQAILNVARQTEPAIDIPLRLAA
jgi:hypothetical protein